MSIIIIWDLPHPPSTSSKDLSYLRLLYKRHSPPSYHQLQRLTPFRPTICSCKWSLSTPLRHGQKPLTLHRLQNVPIYAIYDNTQVLIKEMVKNYTESLTSFHNLNWYTQPLHQQRIRFTAFRSFIQGIYHTFKVEMDCFSDRSEIRDSVKEKPDRSVFGYRHFQNFPDRSRFGPPNFEKYRIGADSDLEIYKFPDRSGFGSQKLINSGSERFWMSKFSKRSDRSGSGSRNFTYFRIGADPDLEIFKYFRIGGDPDLEIFKKSWSGADPDPGIIKNLQIEADLDLQNFK